MTFQPLPAINEGNAAFWGAGANGSLQINRCRDCRTWYHPPAPVCPECVSINVGAERGDGRAVLAAYTVNHQPWAPEMEVPFVLAIVELVEQAPVRLMTRLVDCLPDDVHIGMPVIVHFQQVEVDVWLPLFRPVESMSQPVDDLEDAA